MSRWITVVFLLALFAALFYGMFAHADERDPAYTRDDVTTCTGLLTRDGTCTAASLSARARRSIKPLRSVRARTHAHAREKSLKNFLRPPAWD
jgi:hypothetical protein